MALREPNAAAQEQRGGVVREAGEGVVHRGFGAGGFTVLPAVGSKLGQRPRERLGIAPAAGAGGFLGYFDCAFEIAFQPTDVRDAGVGLETWFEVRHFLIRIDRLVHAALLHERIAEQRVVEEELPLRDEPPGDRLGLAKLVQSLGRVPAQEQRIGLLRLHRLNGERALLGEFVKSRIAAQPRLLHKEPAELFEVARFIRGRGALLRGDDLRVDRVRTAMRRQHERARGKSARPRRRHFRVRSRAGEKKECGAAARESKDSN